MPIRLILLASPAYANQEITVEMPVEMPGREMLDFVWIEPGIPGDGDDGRADVNGR